MKIILAFISCLLLSISVNGQEYAYHDVNKTSFNTKSEVLNHSVALEGCPLESGNSMNKCTEAKLREIMANIEYPKVAKQNLLEQTCEVLFEVGTDGKITASRIDNCNEKVFGWAIKSKLEELEFTTARENGIVTATPFRMNVDFKFKY